MSLPPILNDKEIKNLSGTESRCRFCGSLTYRREDEYHGETICQKCGYVQLKKAEKAITTLVQQAPPKPGHDLHPELYKFLSEDEKACRILQIEKRVDSKSNSKEEWRYQSLYKPYILVLKTEFSITSHHKRWLERFLDRIPYFGGLDTLCRKCSYQQILTSLAIRLMRRDNHRFSINTNKFCKQIGLTTHKYNIIIENLEILQEKGLMNRDRITKTKLELEEKNENLAAEIEMIQAHHKIKEKGGRRTSNA